MLLLDYINENDISKAEAARQLGVRWTTIWRWIKGRSVPQHDHLLKIKEWSGGQVTPNDFVVDAEKVAP